MKYAITWLVLAVAIAIGWGSLDLPSYRRLVTQGIRAEGKIIELHPEHHNTARYGYLVAGQTFVGQKQSWQPNPPLEEMRVGQTVVVYYDPESPEQSVLGDPKPILQNEIISIALAAVIGPAFIVLVWRFRRQKR